MLINENYLNLKDSYLFLEIANRVEAYKKEKPDANIIRLGIGDVTLPLVPVVVEAMTNAVSEMGVKSSFRGYGEYQGERFLQKAISSYYKEKQVYLEENEIFISEGAKSDLGNILDIFSSESIVLIPDPVYPVYVDTNVMVGRKIIYLKGNEDNGFLPLPDRNVDVDIIYLCSPNNPTGTVYNKKKLKIWVDYALEKKAVILFDAAYEAFIKDTSLPGSIYQIEGAKKCAIEFCSLSKTAGFTGTRCGYTVVPKEFIIDGSSLNELWLRRQSTKFNGVSYIVQRGAEAVFSPSGIVQTRKNIEYYNENSYLMANALKDIGMWFVGGDNSPYLWLKCPKNMSSWEFFDFLLKNAGIVGTPGIGFGSEGEGYFRLTAFGEREDIIEAMERFKKLFR